jgi:hypothetical protein
MSQHDQKFQLWYDPTTHPCSLVNLNVYKDSSNARNAAAFSLAGCAAVCEDETDTTGGYTITLAKDAGILQIHDAITQGATNWHSRL